MDHVNVCAVEVKAGFQTSCIIKSAQPKKGVCILAGCGGRVIRRVNGHNHLGPTYDMPKCEDCGQMHFFSDDAPIVP